MSDSKPNVLMISMDTLRADVAYSGKFPTMERLRAEGTSFSNVVSPAPLTPVSHASVFTGVVPPRHGLRHLVREQMQPGVTTIAEIFQHCGYSTAGIASCPGLNRWYGFNRGFGHYDDEIPRLADGSDPLMLADVKLRGTAMKRANVVTDRALAWLDNRPGEPWFLFAHYFDSHWPYEAPESFDVPVANPYEGEVAFMDHHVGRLLKGLDSVGVDIDQTLVICFSDHGEDLAGWYPNDHAGELGHPEEEGHGCCLFDATQMVPLWMRWPGKVLAGPSIDSQVRLIDILPTLGSLLNVGQICCDGESLMAGLRGEPMNDRPAYSETFFREELRLPGAGTLNPWKSVRISRQTKVIWEHTGETVWVFDLMGDPAERDPLVLSGVQSVVTAVSA